MQYQKQNKLLVLKIINNLKMKNNKDLNKKKKNKIKKKVDFLDK